MPPVPARVTRALGQSPTTEKEKGFHMRPRTGPRAAVVALFLSGLLTACGIVGGNATDSGTDSAAPPPVEKVTPQEALELVSAKTSEAKTAKLSIGFTTTMGSGQPQKVQAAGVTDFAAKKMRMTMSANGEKADMVMLGTTMYLRVPGQEPQPGKPWIKFDLAALAKASGTQLNGLTQGANNDPTQALALLKGVSSDIQEVGPEQVRDADTTHYKVQIDLRKAVQQQGTATKKQMTQLLEQMQVRTLPADVWIDDEGRMRKMRYVMKLKPAGAPSTVTTGVSMELFDFGTAVNVVKPPASQTTDFGDLLGGATG
jgi:hypothetical protein